MWADTKLYYLILEYFPFFPLFLISTLFQSLILLWFFSGRHVASVVSTAASQSQNFLLGFCTFSSCLEEKVHYLTLQRYEWRVRWKAKVEVRVRVVTFTMLSFRMWLWFLWPWKHNVHCVSLLHPYTRKYRHIVPPLVESSRVPLLAHWFRLKQFIFSFFPIFIWWNHIASTLKEN